MKIAVIGGKLQGVEASYLAKRAGWEVVLIDKKAGVPATGLCDRFFQLDVTAGAELTSILADVQLVLPALENKAALDFLCRWSKETGKPLVFDAAAYAVSSSKIASNRLFLNTGVPVPRLWPDCSFPIVVKPSGASGSTGVRKVMDLAELAGLEAKHGPMTGAWVIQEFVEGPSYSIEVIGFAGRYNVFQVTELGMDEDYDCKRVLAPAKLDANLVRALEEIALCIAQELELNGIMDVEIILHEGKIKVLEIDARLPSQTPTAVFHSTGLNMVEVLGMYFTGQEVNKKNIGTCRGVVYEHIRVSPGTIKVCGEHIMTGAGPLELREGFFGADAALTNYRSDKKDWVATLIVTASSGQEAWQKRCKVIQYLRKEMALDRYIDL